MFPVGTRTAALMRAASALMTALFLAASPAAALAQSPHTHQHDFGDAERWAHVFDDPRRDAWQKPHEVIQALQLPADAVVADIGAGTGYFAVRLASMLPRGKVYGVDLEPDMVEYLAQRAKREQRDNLVAIKADADNARLPEKVDLVLLVDVFHHIDERVAYFTRLRTSLKSAGRVAIIDFHIDAPMGPPRAARIPQRQVIAEMEAAGYTTEARHDFLSHQYFLVFQPSR